MKSYQIQFLTLVHTLFFRALIGASALAFFSCEEKGDTEGPQVFITKPFENQQILSVDTFLVEATLSDNVQLTSVEVDLVDENFNSVIAKQRYEASGSNFNFSVNFELNAPSLESGTYYVVVRGNDGTNSSQAFRRVNLSAIPLELEQIFVVTSRFNNISVFSGPGGSEWEQRLSLFADYAGAALNYQEGILGIAGGEVGDCVFYDSGTFDVVNTIPGFGELSLPFFLGLKYSGDSREFSLLLREPRLRIFDKWGQPSNGFPLIENYLPIDVFDVGDAFFLCEKPIANPNHILTTYARPGLLLSSLAVAGPVRGVFEKSTNERFVWVDAQDQVELGIMNTQSNLISTPYTREGEALHDVIEISQNVFVIATSTGLYRYNYGNGGTFLLNGDITADKVFYEKLSGTIYAISGPTMTRLTPNGAVMQSHDFADDVEHIAFDYNR